MSKRSNNTSNSLLDEKRRKKVNNIENNIDWPKEFKELETIHFRLNSYFTFLSTRKHVITSFDLLKEPVEKVIKRGLEVEDVARICALIPNDIVFEYVDKNQFIVDEKHFTWKDGFKQNELDMFKLKDQGEEEAQILLFEFIDGNMKKSKSKTGFNSNMKLPTYSADAIKSLILKRNEKFKKSINKFIIAHRDDPWKALELLSKKYIPNHIEFIDPMEQMNTITSTSTHKPISNVLDRLKGLPFFNQQITDSSIVIVPSKHAQYSNPETHLHEDLLELLAAHNISQLYRHQSKAIDSIIKDGKNVISTTPTSSGKSLVYQLPILQSLLDNEAATSLLLFPTKALSQDQFRSLTALTLQLPSLSANHISTFDGDTPKDERLRIRSNAEVILTNPDTLHATIIPNHLAWQRFLKDLKYVVIDELHAYRGTFGAHVAYIIRRLRRVLSMYGNHNVQFISCSATLSKPKEHMASMFGISEDNIDWIGREFDGAPCGARYVTGWNPAEGSGMVGDTARIVVELIKLDVRCIVFCAVRKTVELVMKDIRRIFKDDLKSLARVMSYRGGYSARDRRKIEEQMWNGGLCCIVATNALEVGIDVGGLDAVVMCGFPVSKASFEQEMGRAGRRGLDSLCMLVAGDDPVSQWYVGHMDKLINEEGWEDLCVDLSNVLVMEGHLQCAVKEKFMKNNEMVDEWSNWWNPINYGSWEKVVRSKLNWDEEENVWKCSDRYLPWPAMHVSIRAIEEDTFAVVDITNGREVIIEKIEASRTTFTLYEGGIFIHQGLSYLVREFNVDEKYALVERVNVDWTTSQRDFTDVDPVEIEKIRSLEYSDVPVYFGSICKTMVVFGFFKIDKRGKILDAVEVHNPPVEYHSKGIWIDIPDEAIALVKSKGLSVPGGIHASQHAMMNILPLYIAGGADEVDSECKAPEKEFAKRESARKRPARLVLFDNKGGWAGCGLSVKVFENVEIILDEALRRMVNCDCDWGCPKCCAGAKCKENSLVLSKYAAIIILQVILGIKVELENIPNGPEPNMPVIEIETILPVKDFKRIKISQDVEVVDVRKAKDALSVVIKTEGE